MAAVIGRLLLVQLALVLAAVVAADPARALRGNDTLISQHLFWELEELARIVDISYCVGTAGLGIQKPFQCASRCADRDFETFELVTAWNTGPFLSDSCGYIALDHSKTNPRIIIAFRGTYSLVNTIADLSTIPQSYVPYPGDDDDGDDESSSTFFTPGPSNPSNPSPPDHPACPNCTVHTGFYTSWLHTRPLILEHLVPLLALYPSHTLTLVGHSLGGAVATLGGLDFLARGLFPIVTTFGEPRLGNYQFTQYVDARFNVSRNHETNRLRRVTHKGDPVPLLPLEEWGYDMHGEEVYIGKQELPVGIADVRFCEGDEDENCIAGSDKDKGSWGGPARFKFWQLWFAHRDYFWRLGLCLPGMGGQVGEWYSRDDGGQEAEIEEL